MNSKFTFLKTFLCISILLALSFTAHSAYVVNGSATANGNDCYTLTPPIQGQVGAVWYENLMSLNYNFDMTFQVYLGSDDGGADGIAFVMQPNSTGLGISGGGIGYMGISPSIAVEYDTWQNDDPYYDHIAVHKNGDITTTTGAVAGPVQASASSDNIEDGQWHSTRITWDAATKTLTVYFDGVLRLTYVNDIIANTFNGNPAVFWGFTGATGGAFNLQQFCVTSLIFEEAAEIPISPWAIALGIFLILSVSLLRFRKSL
jgi:hypothetical protein